MSNQPDPVTELTPEAQAIVSRAQAWDAIDPAFGSDACERVLARVEAVTGPAAPIARRGPGRVVLFTLLTAAVVAGGMAAKSMRANPTKPVAAAIASASSTKVAEREEPRPETPGEVPSIDVTALPTAPSETKPTRPSGPTTEGTTLAEELRLTTAARKALATSDAAGALRALDEHERRFPNGQLAQERDSLRIQALVADGQVAAAKARAAAFRARYPGGLLLPSVERALDAHD